MKLVEIQWTREQAEVLLGREHAIVKDYGFEEGDLVRVVIVREVEVIHQDPNHKFKTIKGSRREPNGESILFRVTRVEKSPEGLKDGYCILWWEEVIIVRRDRVYPDTKYIKGEV